MRDIHRDTKNTLLNFVEWARSNGVGLPAPETADANIEAFLSTQSAGQRHIPCCGHCGSDAVVPCDFKNEVRKDREGKVVEHDSKGPAWHCKACDRRTERKENEQSSSR